MNELMYILFLGVMLGLKHALEPDHIIAVSTIVSETKKISKAALIGVWWGVGHAATLFIIGASFIILKKEIPQSVALSLELCVGIMLVYLGIKHMFFTKREDVLAHEHSHEFSFHKHYHLKKHKHNNMVKNISLYIKPLFIGAVHGLSGSAALILLTMTTLKTVHEAVLYILFFGAGTIIGMLMFTVIIGIPFVKSANNSKLNVVFTKLTGAISMCFGLYYMYQISVVDGLFS